MPSAKKVGWAQLKVGIVAIIAMSILATLIFLITSGTSLFQKQAVLYTYLVDSAAMAKGAEVRLNGMQIGEVSKLELADQARMRAAGMKEEEIAQRVILVELKVRAEMLPSIPVDSEAYISAPNVLGSKYINISKGRKAESIKAGAEIKSRNVAGYEDVVASGYSTMESAKEMLKRIDGVVTVIEQGKGSIGKLIYDEQLYANLNGTAAEARKITQQLNTGKGTVSKLLYDEQLLDDIRSTITRVNRLVEGLEQGQGTAGKLLKDTALHDDIRKTIAEYRTIAANLNAGKGTAGKLLQDEATIKQINTMLARLDDMMARINSGQGTLGQLMVNPQLYESLNGTTREFHEFMKDFRKNPKKFLSIKLGLF